VKRRGFEIQIVIGILLFFSFLVPASGADKGSKKSGVNVQGMVMAVDLKKKIMTVNEKPFLWDQQTAFYNEKGSATTVDKLKADGWVYIVGDYDDTIKMIKAKKVYLLSKYVSKQERYRYPFMEQQGGGKQVGTGR
jgi:hypothetical protein